jgi:hypothetical protein
MINGCNFAEGRIPLLSYRFVNSLIREEQGASTPARRGPWTRGGIVVAAVVAVALAVIVVVSIASGNGPSSGNYCLFYGTDSQSGRDGTLAVPQASASQSSCDALAETVEQAFANSQTGVTSFTITSDHPASLSAGQTTGLPQFNPGTGWLIYSGSL